MTKEDMARKLSFRMNISKKEAKEIINTILDAIIDNFKNGSNKLEIRSFGSFKIITMRAKRVKLPFSSQIDLIPQKKKPSFRTSKKLLKDINENPNCRIQPQQRSSAKTVIV